VTRSIFRLLPPPGCPTGTVIAPGDMRGYRRAGESGLRDTQVFFNTRLVACCGQEMPCVRRVQSVRRRAGEPLQIQPVCLRNRQAFALTGAVCEDVPVVVARSAQLDSGGTTDRLRGRIWWPVVCFCERPANRELRCNSGTAPPLCPGDSLRSSPSEGPRGERGRLLSGHCDPHGEAVRIARRHAVG
jgi:hypothetical protein